MTRQNSKNVWVFVELREGKIAPVVLELLGEGKKLAQGLEERLCAVVLSSGTDESIPEQLSQYGADVVYSVESPLLEHYTTDGYILIFESNSIYVHSAAGGASSASIRPSSSFSQSSRRSAQSVSLTAWSFSSSKSSRRKTRLVADRQYFPRSKSLYARLVM